MKNLVIIGAGSVGGHISYNFRDYNKNQYRLLGFLDDDPEKQGKTIFGQTVLGSTDLLFEMEDIAVVIGIAFPYIKRKIAHKLRFLKNIYFPSMISSRAWVSKSISIGKGSLIYPGTCINYGCNLGEFVVVNMNCSIGHNCTIGNYSSLSPGVNFAGYTNIGKGVEMGIGASTRQNTLVGDWAVIGGQTMLVKNVESQSTVFGVPGEKRISHKESLYIVPK